MPIAVNWDNEEKTIIRWQFLAKWTWDDYYGALQNSRKLTQQATTMIDVIVDMRASKSLPSHLFTHAQNAIQTTSLNVGTIVVIGVTPLLRFAFNTFKRLYDATTGGSRHELYLVAHDANAYKIFAKAQARREQSSTRG
ncbi:MAG: hypothetical protein Q9P44_20045 [Anaerolineae bacterium]|nr:hypothetical protein [Anaerolineae bacterium]